MRLDPTEARILGALVEKRWSTPDQYPLTINALVAACNQKSNRLPAMSLEEFEISGCLLGLRQRGLVFVVERVGSRTQRYEGHFAEELGVERSDSAILAELLLRGPQTATELERRCSRMAPSAGLDDVLDRLRGLAGRGFVRQMPRESGQRHARWTQLLCTDAAPVVDEPPAEPAAPPAAAADPSIPAPVSLHDEVAALRTEVAELRRRVGELEADGSG